VENFALCLNSLQAQLERLDAQKQGPDPSASAGFPKAELERVFAERRFHHPRESEELVGFVERIKEGAKSLWEWIKYLVRKLLHMQDDKEKQLDWSDKLVRLVFFILLGILAGIMVYYLLQGLKQVAVAEHEIKEELPLVCLDEKALRQEADGLALEGNFRMALRRLFLSVLARLQSMRVIEYNNTRTNQEYLQSVSSHPGLYRAFAPVVDAFDRIWYGLAEIDGEDYWRFQRMSDNLMAQAKRDGPGSMIK